MPKARRVIWLPEATRDVDRLRGFVELKNSHAARRAGRTILKAVGRIKENPGLGRPVEELPEFREIIVPFGMAQTASKGQKRSANISKPTGPYGRGLRPVGSTGLGSEGPALQALIGSYGGPWGRYTIARVRKGRAELPDIENVRGSPPTIRARLSHALRRHSMGAR